MKIIEPSATLVDEINPEEILLKLEKCGRVSRLSKARDEMTAHPQMRQVANQILDILRDKLPVIVEDIIHA